ncbi:unnamed protein product [Phaedon cochleariae]|uniref:MADF domain-containing protein n=1 Tax=Phaedon cochleariae TaxID=80249 RepID=A0A9N9SJ77_PHACE|nr:unnamed protein product [Phaedon cochleariae]
MSDPDHDYILEDFCELEAAEATQSQSEIPSEQEGTLDPGLLIEAIQQFEYLYDLSNKSYKDSKKKYQAWQHISRVLNSSVEECMKLWKHLRDRFVKEKKKFPSGAGAPISNWVHFDAMLFYNKFTKKRKTFTATKKNPISRPSSSASVWSTVTMESVTSPESRTESPLEEATSPGNFTEQEEQPVADPSGIKRKLPTGRTPTTPIGVQGRKKKINKEEKLDEILGMAKSITNVFGNRQAVPSNANSTFVQYLYEELERMPAEEALQKRKQILLLLFNDE